MMCPTLAAAISGSNSMLINCTNDCSGHGDCYNGVCFCEVQFSGGNCTEPNINYYIGFSSVFYVISLVSFTQLLWCIKAEFNRMKTPSIIGACRVTLQKAIYLITCLATSLRGFYFSSPSHATFEWTASLMSAYYPLVLTGFSLIVCFWAEVFHLRDLSFERQGFLSKSFLGFIIFNMITYSLLLAELLLIQYADSSEKTYLTSVFNGCYAGIMFVCVIFFLFYGVEVYFKVRGAFTANVSTLPNSSQLHQSRFGLVSQALFLLATTGFILSDVVGNQWKDKVPVLSRNFHNVFFRIAELSIALWFPCCLWNCVSPETLWILNPKQILRHLEGEKLTHGGEVETLVSSSKAEAVKSDSNTDKQEECWICYDNERTDAGLLIQPCLCKGDMSAVHHECLKQWLIESSDNQENVKCKVCNEEYQLERETVWLPFSLSSQHWLQTAAIITFMSSTVGGACLLVKLFDSVGIRTLAVGVAVLVQYVCLKLLGFNLMIAYHRAKFSAIKILGHNNKDLPSSTASTIMETIIAHEKTPMATNKPTV